MQVKICPTCKRQSSLDAPVCQQCGHVFRTQFTQPFPPTATVRQTAQFPVPKPSLLKRTGAAVYTLKPWLLIAGIVGLGVVILCQAKSYGDWNRMTPEDRAAMEHRGPAPIESSEAGVAIPILKFLRENLNETEGLEFVESSSVAIDLARPGFWHQSVKFRCNVPGLDHRQLFRYSFWIDKVGVADWKDETNRDSPPPFGNVKQRERDVTDFGR